MQSLSQRLAARCAEDGEFRLASRFWDGGVSVDFGDGRVDLALGGGGISAGVAADPRSIRLAGPAETWKKVLSPLPPPFFNDIMPARAFGLTVEGDEETFWQYYPAVRRLVDLLREEVNRDAALR
jgi:hypothetical protein